MSGVGVSVSVLDTEDVLDKVVGDLDVLAGVFGDLRPLMRAIGEYGVSSTRERFVTNVDPSGEPWLPSERSELTGGKIQDDTGRLKRSMTANVLGTDGVEWGTNLIYGAQRQFGGVIRAKYAARLRWKGPSGSWHSAEEVFQPPRPYLGISEDDELSIGEIIQVVIEESFA